MSKYDAELQRRLLSGEPIEETRKWFFECRAKDYLAYSDSTLQEQKFLDKTYDEAVEWWRQQRKDVKTLT
jgi:hypothetical protein